MDRRNQVVIYGNRDCICIQRCFPCILVSSLLCKKVCLLRIGLIHGGNGIFILCVRRIQSLECRFTQAPVAAFHIRNVAADRQRMLFAICSHRIRKMHICIVEHGEDVRRSFRDLFYLCQKRFRRCIQDVAAHSRHLCNRPLVIFKLRQRFKILCKPFRLKCQKLRLHPCTGL